MAQNANPRTLGPLLPVPSGNAVLLDFEATCSNGPGPVQVPRNEMEIIEIGAIAVDENLNTLSEFSRFVRPVRHPILSNFATELTTITQADVDGAETFYEVAADLALWAAENEISWWGSWGKYDRSQLTQDVQFHRVPDPLPQPHFNVKEAFTARQSIKRRLGLGGAVKLAGLQFEGTAHRAISDTRNIVRLLPFILGDSLTPRSNFAPVDVEERVSRR